MSHVCIDNMPEKTAKGPNRLFDDVLQRLSSNVNVNRSNKNKDLNKGRRFSPIAFNEYLFWIL